MTASGAEPTPPRREVRQRSELEVRWRQARNAPPPVVRAVLANAMGVQTNTFGNPAYCTGPLSTLT